MLMAHALGSQLNSKLSVRRTFCSRCSNCKDVPQISRIVAHDCTDVNGSRLTALLYTYGCICGHATHTELSINSYTWAWFLPVNYYHKFH